MFKVSNFVKMSFVFVSFILASQLINATNASPVNATDASPEWPADVLTSTKRGCSVADGDLTDAQKQTMQKLKDIGLEAQLFKYEGRPHPILIVRSFRDAMSRDVPGDNAVTYQNLIHLNDKGELSLWNMHPVVFNEGYMRSSLGFFDYLIENDRHKTIPLEPWYNEPEHLWIDWASYKDGFIPYAETKKEGYFLQNVKPSDMYRLLKKQPTFTDKVKNYFAGYKNVYGMPQNLDELGAIDEQNKGTELKRGIARKVAAGARVGGLAMLLGELASGKNSSLELVNALSKKLSKKESFKNLRTGKGKARLYRALLSLLTFLAIDTLAGASVKGHSVLGFAGSQIQKK